MKVALISHEGGGVFSVSSGLAKSLAKKGIDTTIFTGSHLHGCQTRKLGDHLKITYLPTPDLPPRSLWFQVLNSSRLLKAFKDYDVIHGVSPNASFGLTLFRKRVAKPFVATLHEDHRTSQRAFANQPTSSWTLRDLGYFFLEFPLHDFTVSRVLADSDHVTLCSYSLLEQLAAYGNLDYGKTSVIYNGIDFDEIEMVEDRSADDGDEISIIYAGRMYWVKGIMFLLEAFNHIGKDIKNVSLKIFGKGPLKERVERFIVDSGLGDRVSFPGHVSHQELLAEIKKSHIVVYPSLCEAQPMFMLEAMACRKPLLAFDLPFAREIITNMDTGLLAKAGDIEDLSRKIRLLVSDERLRYRLGEAGYNHVRKKHDWDTQSEKYLNVYERVMDRK